MVRARGEMVRYIAGQRRARRVRSTYVETRREPRKENHTMSDLQYISTGRTSLGPEHDFELMGHLWSWSPVQKLVFDVEALETGDAAYEQARWEEEYGYSLERDLDLDS